MIAVRIPFLAHRRQQGSSTAAWGSDLRFPTAAISTFYRASAQVSGSGLLSNGLLHLLRTSAVQGNMRHNLRLYFDWGLSPHGMNALEAIHPTFGHVALRLCHDCEANAPLLS